MYLDHINYRKTGILLAFLVQSLSVFSMTQSELNLKMAGFAKRVDSLSVGAERIRDRQPDFADWIKHQNVIFTNFKKAALFDIKYKPNRLKATLSDWQSLLERMEHELKVYGNMLDPATTGRINVRDFGAKGDGRTNDAPAFRRAFAAASKGPKRHVFIPAGKYLIDHAKKNDPECVIFHLKGYKDVLISGETGSVLIAKNPRSLVFKLEQCENVRLQNFHRTSAKPFYTTGIIKASYDDVMDVKIDKGRLSPLDPIFAQSDRQGLVRIMSGETLADGITPAAYCVKNARSFWKAQVRSLGNGLYEFKRPANVKIPARCYKPGQRLVYYARDHRKSTVSLIDSNHCRIDRVSMDSSSGMPFYSKCSDATFITRCRIQAPKGSFIVSSADGLYSQWASLGSYLAGNTFKHLGDDFINVNSLLLPVHIQQKNVLYVTSYLPDDYLPRLKRISILHCYKGENYPSEVYFIKSATHVMRKAGKVDVKLLRLELGRVPGKLKTTAPEISMRECHKRRAFKKEKFDMVYFPDLHSSGMVLADNVYAHGVSRILPFGSNCLMVNNRFEENLDLHVLMEYTQTYMPWWVEAYYSSNVAIKDNYFKSTNKSVISFQSIRFDPKNKDTYLPHVFITGNKFEMLPGMNKRPIFYIKACDDLEIINNNIKAVGGERRGAVFYIRDSRLKIEGNREEGNFATHKVVDCNVLFFK